MKRAEKYALLVREEEEEEEENLMEEPKKRSSASQANKHEALFLLFVRINVGEFFKATTMEEGDNETTTKSMKTSINIKLWRERCMICRLFQLSSVMIHI